MIHRPAGAGQSYALGPMHRVFKAGGTETADTYSILEWWLEPGTAGVVHDFSNPDEVRAGLLNIYIPGGFEQEMPGIVAWFAAQAR